MRPTVRGARLAGVVVLVAALLGLGACGGGGGFSAYCDEVKAQQRPITEALGQSPSTALLDALPSFEKLAAKSPEDIADDWGIVVRRISLLRQALDDASIDPSTYDSKHPPAGLTDEQKTAIDAAASSLASQETQQALINVQQEARDVCQTPLSL